MLQLSSTLAILKERSANDEFEVHNFGVCGYLQSFPSKFERGQVLSVKTIYAQKNHEEMEFKSFSSQKIGEADLISTSDRILSTDAADYLSNFAPLVDREAWAMAYTCHKQNIPFTCTKVISDFADGEICARVKEESEQWSEALLRHFLTLEASESIDSHSFKDQLKDLHITISQERSLNNLFKALEIKGFSLTEVLNQCDYKDLLSLEVRPKEKTKELIKRMGDLLNPLEKQLRERLNEVTSPLQRAGFKVRYDQGHENDVIHLTTSLEQSCNINQLISGLEEFEYLKFKEILRGKDV